MAKLARGGALVLSAGMVLGCGPGSSATLPSAISVPTIARAPVSVETATLAFRTPTPVQAPPTRSANVAEVTFRWDVGTIITDVDDVTELSVRLRDRPGIEGAYGDEFQITVVYDPQQITPQSIQRILADLGFPAKLP